MSNKIIVIGIATGSGNLETWGFGSHEEAKPFCEWLARTTQLSVIVLEGEIIGAYSIEDIPVKFTPFSERFNELKRNIQFHESSNENAITPQADTIKNQIND